MAKFRLWLLSSTACCGWFKISHCNALSSSFPRVVTGERGERACDGILRPMPCCIDCLPLLHPPVCPCTLFKLISSPPAHQGMSLLSSKYNLNLFMAHMSYVWFTGRCVPQFGYVGVSHRITAVQTSNWHETNLGSIEDWISKENLAVRVNLPVGLSSFLQKF